MTRNELRAVKFPYSAAGKLEAPLQHRPYDHSENYRGWGQPVDADGIDLNVDSHQGVLDSIAGIFAKTIALHEDTVGGPIDIGFIGVDVQDGPRWIRRKDASLDI
jgi:hypothetical protein